MMVSVQCMLVEQDGDSDSASSGASGEIGKLCTNFILGNCGVDV